MILQLIATIRHQLASRLRPKGDENARRLRERGESVESIVFRDATAADIPALAELHVTTWNATYNTAHGPSVAIRIAQWTEKFAKRNRRDFVLVLQDHGLGLGRSMMQETARRFLDRGRFNGAYAWRDVSRLLPQP